MQSAVILSTYNSPAWLEKVLWGYGCQTTRDFEIVVADDGSGPETRDTIDRVRESVGVPIRHVWQADKGFRKCKALNKAILAADADYLIFSDGDCIPRLDFVERHAADAERGYFLSGGYCKLNLEVSRVITREDIARGDVTSPRWLVANGQEISVGMLKLAARSWRARALNLFTPTKITWNGHNASGWRDDLLRINGFDERMGYWAEDRELGERLMNAGVHPKQIRYRTTCVHLEHARPYHDPEVLERNLEIRRDTLRSGRVRTPCGIEQAAASPARP